MYKTNIIKNVPLNGTPRSGRASDAKNKQIEGAVP